MKKKIIIVSIISLIVITLLTFIVLNIVSLKVSGNKEIIVKLDEKYSNAKATACVNTLIKCKDISNKIKVSGKVDTTKIGTYEVKYQVKYGILKKEVTKKITVVDDIAPVIELTGNTDVTLCPKGEYKEEGYTATDNYDDNVNVIIEEIDNKIVYTATDTSNNTSSASRSITRKDDEAPKINIESNVFVKQNTKYKDEFSATDNCDGDISSKVKVSGTVDASKDGNYTINYEVEDESGNKTTATKNIIVYKINNPSNATNKIIYLTFDDGPGQFTEQLLDVLAKYNVPATFFVTAQYGYENVMKRIVNEGHAIAIHTYSHDYKKIYQSSEAYFNDLEKMANKIYEVTGKRTNLLRFPGGSSNMVSKYNPGIMTYLTAEVERRGYKYFDWNIDSMDTSTYDSETIKNNVINNLGNGTYVVLQHDIKQHSVNAVEGIIQYGLANGYTFLALNPDSYGAHHHVNN